MVGREDKQGVAAELRATGPPYETMGWAPSEAGLPLAGCLLHVLVGSFVATILTHEAMIGRLCVFVVSVSTALNFHNTDLDNRDGACTMEPRADAFRAQGPSTKAHFLVSRGPRDSEKTYCV